MGCVGSTDGCINSIPCVATHMRRRNYDRVRDRPGFSRYRRQMESDGDALIGRYVLLDVIGYGTTSVVYLCEHDGPNKGDGPFACKAIDKRKFCRPGPGRRGASILDQLRVEIHVLQSVRHPNVIQLLDVVETDNKIFIITELMERELFEHIIECGSLRENEAAAMLWDICSGLACLHQHGIMHRDLKPENLLMKRSGSGRWTLKIVDFGLSRTNHQIGESFMGTAGYLAPELRQRKPYSNAVDIWGLGVILYLLLSGTLPFSSEVAPLPGSGTPLAEYVLRFPSAQWDCISSGAKHLVWAMLQVDPELRITAEQILEHPWVQDAGSKAPKTVIPSLHSSAFGPTGDFRSFFLEPFTVRKANNLHTMDALTTAAKKKRGSRTRRRRKSVSHARTPDMTIGPVRPRTAGAKASRPRSNSHDSPMAAVRVMRGTPATH